MDEHLSPPLTEPTSTDIVLNLRYESIVPRFLELRRAELEPIGAALEAGDFETLQRFGHNLHGTGAGYGLDALSLIGARLEEAAMTQNGEFAAHICAELTNFLRDVRLSYRNSVLFVDDQAEIVTLLRRLFAADQYLCYFASSATQALEILNHCPIDVMVSDLVMPEMGGLELLSIVRQRFPQVVRLVLSGQAQVPSILAAINAGQVFRYLTKPWRVDGDARAVIAEAVAYANELSQQQSRYLHVSLDALTQLLDATHKSYLVLGREHRVEAVSADLVDKWGRGYHVSGRDLGPENGQLVALDSSHSVWLPKPRLKE